ncbi:MAG: thioredoxin-dependent thiol peroxidase [Rhodothalassiaceae bacterium]
MAEKGQPAPDFTVQTDAGETVSLKDYAGRKLVLYFYPRDDTPGCTKEAIAFTEAKQAFAQHDTEILGISRDTVAKHGKFRDKHALTIPLGSDEEGRVCEAYGVWVEKKMYGKTSMGIERSTFLIDRSGTIAAAWRKVKVAGHAEEVLKAAMDLD